MTTDAPAPKMFGTFNRLLEEDGGARARAWLEKYGEGRK